MEVALLLLDLSGLGFLTCLKKPAKVVLLELDHILMLVLLSDLNALVPAMELLVHSHGFLNLVMLDQDGFSLMELLVEHSHFGLNTEVVRAFCCNKFVELAKVVSLCNITEGSVTSLSNVEIVLLHGEFGKRFPIGLGLWSQVELLQNVNSCVEASVLEGSSKLNETFIKFVRDRVVTVIDKNFSLVLSALDALDITFDLVHSNLIRLLDGIPDAQIRSVLGDDNIRVGHPIYELAVVEQALLGLFLDAVKIELLALVTEEELGATRVELEVIDLGVVADISLNLPSAEVLDADSHLVK